MASYYVWSGATGSANGTSWANAYTTLVGAMTGKAAGDIFYVAHDHAESQGTTLTLTVPGTVASQNKFICANRSGSVPPVSADRRATATVTTTGTVALILSSGVGTGNAHYDGIIFTGSSGSGAGGIVVAGGTGSPWQRFDNCSFRLASTGSPLINIGNSGTTNPTQVEFNNCTVSFAGTGNIFTVSGGFRWRNTASALIGAAVPTTLLRTSNTTGTDVECIGVDLSAAGSGKTIVSLLFSCFSSKYRFIDCKLDAAVTKASSVPVQNSEADFLRSGATGNYMVSSHRSTGVLTEETTIVRSAGGATDGVTPISWKIITTVNSSYSLPFVCPPIAIWNDTTGSAVTATVEGIWGGGAVPLDSEIWLECEFLSDASSPQGGFAADCTADLLTTAANQTSSSESWGGSTTPFKLSVTFTAQQKGWVYGRVKVGKASSTLYVDPLITLS